MSKGENKMEPVEKLKTEIATLTQGAELMIVTTRDEYTVLCKQEDVAIGIKKQVEEYWNPSVEKAFALHRELTGKRKAFLDPLEAFIKTCKRVGGNYLMAEQRKAQEQAAALAKEATRIREAQEAEARKAAEVLKARQEAELATQKAVQEAERKAQAAEQSRKEMEFKNSPAEKARIAAEFKAKQEAERFEQERQAEITRVRQAEERAEADRQAKARMIDTSLVPHDVPKADAGAGRAVVQNWIYDVVDEALVPRKYLLLNHKAIQAEVTSFKDKTMIPGIKPKMDASVRRTGR